MKPARLFLICSLAFLTCLSPSRGSPAVPRFGTADLGNGIVLHYAEEGHGPPIVFVHGSLSSMEYWTAQLAGFAPAYRAIAYSRRYNFPNANPSVPGYSAITDANDLARLIERLDLGPVYLVGHSYGAFAALFLAMRHPELIRAMVLAEPPAVPLLLDVEGAERTRALAMHADIERRMVAPIDRKSVV